MKYVYKLELEYDADGFKERLRALVDVRLYS